MTRKSTRSNSPRVRRRRSLAIVCPACKSDQVSVRSTQTEARRYYPEAISDRTVKRRYMKCNAPNCGHKWTDRRAVTETVLDAD